MTTTTQTIDNKAVLSFLSDNTDFFINNKDALEKMTLPATTAEASVSFHEFQVKQLQSKLEKLELLNKRLTQIAMDNAESQQKLNSFSLNLIQCDTIDELETTLKVQLKEAFTLESVMMSMDSEIKGITKSVTLRRAENTCLHEENGVCIRSEAIIKLTTPHDGVIGHLTLGSVDIQRFHEGQGDELLQYLGGIVGYCLNKLTQ